MFTLNSAIYFGLFNAIANVYMFLVVFLGIRVINIYVCIYAAAVVLWSLKCWSYSKNRLFIFIAYVPCLTAGLVNYFYPDLHAAQFIAFIPGLIFQGVLFSKLKNIKS
jgi:hypothetical protein